MSSRPLAPQLDFHDCGEGGGDPAQIEAIRAAVDHAHHLAERAYRYIQNEAPTNRAPYEQFFGPYDSERRDVVIDTLTGIRNAFIANAFQVHCTGMACKGGDLAYVPDRSAANIFFCPSFHDAPPTSRAAGEDSRSSTVFHEVSHLLGAGNTEDYAKTLDAVRALATMQPGKAVHNSYSYEYFAVSLDTPGCGCRTGARPKSGSGFVPAIMLILIVSLRRARARR